MTAATPMRSRRPDLWTIVVTTAVTLLIWYWAAGETQVEQPLDLRVQLRIADADPWRLEPAAVKAEVRLQGSRRAMRDAEGGLRELRVDLPAEVGRQTVDLAAALRRHPDVVASGVTVLGCDPVTIEIDADRIVTRTARVLRSIAGTRTEGEVTVEPAEVQVSLPSRALVGLSDDLVVEPVLSREELDGIEAGRRTTLPGVNLRPAGGLPSGPSIRITPARVSVTFAKASPIQRLALEAPVRVQILAPPEDEGRVELEPKVLRGVVIEAPVATIDAVRQGKSIVVAVVQLKSDERLRGVPTKSVACFVVIHQDGHAELVRGLVGDAAEEHPIINVRVAKTAEGS